MRFTSVADLPSEAARLKEWLWIQGIKSAAVVPMVLGKSIFGLLGFSSLREEKTWSDESITLLKIVGEILANALHRKQVEEELKRSYDQLERRTGELEAVNKELEAFSYSVSHDLRAPLRHADSYTQLLLEDHADKLDEQGKGYCSAIAKSCRRMRELIDDLLKLSRITREKLNRESIDLSVLAQKIARELKKSKPERRVKFIIADSLNAYCDPRLMRVVLDNLLGNAWKFTSGKSEAKIEFGKMVHNVGVAFYVRDNGAGFNQANVHKLFTPFRRLHRRAEFEGSGIGLATVQRIIHRHGGKVWAEGKVGKGATFYFTLNKQFSSLSDEET